jgi:hypothetical protein
MSFYNRLKKKIAKLEKNIEKKQQEIKKLNIDCERKLISDFDMISEKKRNEDKIKTMNIRLRILKGESVKRKRLMKDKISKKRQRKNRENKYFEWSMKREVDN